MVCDCRKQIVFWPKAAPPMKLNEAAKTVNRAEADLDKKTSRRTVSLFQLG